MTKTRVITLTIWLAFQIGSAAAASRDCELIWDHVLGYSPKEMCDKYFGYKCSASKSDAEMLCRASGRMDECVSFKNLGQVFCLAFGGSICMDARTELEGLCMAAGEPLCDKPNPDRRFWLRKLLEKCGKPAS